MRLLMRSLRVVLPSRIADLRRRRAGVGQGAHAVAEAVVALQVLELEG